MLRNIEIASFGRALMNKDLGTRYNSRLIASRCGRSALGALALSAFGLEMVNPGSKAAKQTELSWIRSGPFAEGG